jgi:hypothetical protein
MRVWRAAGKQRREVHGAGLVLTGEVRAHDSHRSGRIVRADPSS